jgi:hypothetical protein
LLSMDLSPGCGQRRTDARDVEEWKIRAWCEQHFLQRTYIWSSRLRYTYGPESDVAPDEGRAEDAVA